MITECDCAREEFSAYLGNELDADARLTVENHLCECADCLRELDGFKKVGDLYRTLPFIPAPIDFDAQLRAALQPPQGFSLIAFLERHRMAVLAAALLLSAVAGIAGMEIFKRNREFSNTLLRPDIHRITISPNATARPQPGATPATKVLAAPADAPDGSGRK